MTGPASDLGLVRARRLVDDTVEITFPLAPGDRSLVEAGESVVAGAPIAERLRDPRLVDLALPAQSDPQPGQRIPVGELLFDWRGRWRIAGGEMSEPLETPVAGIVREVRTGQPHRGPRRRPGDPRDRGPGRSDPRPPAHGRPAPTASCASGGLDVGLAGHDPRRRAPGSTPRR